MSLALGLLEQAQHLAHREPWKPRQASLRRAVSACYYALFHLLVDDGARRVAVGRNLAGVRSLTRRAFTHGEMLAAARSFSAANLPTHVDEALGSPRMPKELLQIAETFAELQQARHQADYDASRRFSRGEVDTVMVEARNAFTLWRSVRRTPLGQVFLHALFAWDAWRARRPG